MIVTPVEMKLHLPPPPNPRSKGVHASGLTRAIAIETGILDKKWFEGLDDISISDIQEIKDQASILRINIGLAWEAWYIPTFLTHVHKHPKEMCKDDIYMTHDGESVDTILIERKKQQVLRIHEVKATYKSLKQVKNDNLESQWMWITQIKTYCKGANTTHACLHALFINGDYTPPYSPVLKIWNITFTQKEIDDTWDLLTQYRDYREGNR